MSFGPYVFTFVLLSFLVQHIICASLSFLVHHSYASYIKALYCIVLLISIYKELFIILSITIKILNHNYAFSEWRIIIPIHDRFHNILNFTERRGIIDIKSQTKPTSSWEFFQRNLLVSTCGRCTTLCPLRVVFHIL